MTSTGFTRSFFSRFLYEAIYMKLRSTILISVIFPLLLALSATSILGLWILEDAMRTRQQEDVQLIAKSIRMPMSYALKTNQMDMVQQSLSSAFAFKRMYGAYVFDPTGKRIAGLGLGNDAFSDERLVHTAAQGKETGRYIQQNGQDYYSFLVPLTDTTGKPLGVLQVNRLSTGVEKYINVVTVGALLLSIIVILLIVLLVWWGLKRYVEQPLGRLFDSMRKVQQGNRAHRTRPRGPHEVRELATTFNTMLDAMADKDREVALRQQKELELERRLKKSRKLAEIGVLAAGVAHELGSPLTVVKGQARKLMQTATSNAERKRLQRITHEVDRMVAIIQQLINLGRRHNLNKHDSSLVSLLHDSLLLLEQEVQASEASISVMIDSPEQDLLIHVDQARFQQILTNLIKNAIQAAPNGRVVISAERDETASLIHIEDSGAGIQEEDKPYLFDPFFTTKSVGKGSGLGLSVAHRITEDHGGTIQVTDSALGGARFTIHIPNTSTEAE